MELPSIRYYTKQRFKPNEYSINEDTAIIHLQNNLCTLIDVDNLERVINLCRWVMDGDYVCGMVYDSVTNKRKKLLLHRFILNMETNSFIDHINGNGKDNRQKNLRISTNKQNQENRKATPSDNTSSIRGVYYRKDRGKWECSIHVHENGKRTRKLRKLVNNLVEAKIVMMKARRQFYSDSIENRSISLNLMGEITSSYVNGPGERHVIWLQGCSHHCKNCWNPESWSFNLKNSINTLDLAIQILSKNPQGLTISGGEPFQQPEALLQFLKFLHNDDNTLSAFPQGIICFTGYTIEELRAGKTVEELENDPAWQCLQYIDLIIDGRYIEEQRVYESLRGSSNQQFYYNQLPNRGKTRVNEVEILNTQNFELQFINENLMLTGFPELNENAKKYLNKVGVKIIYKQ